MLKAIMNERPSQAVGQFIERSLHNELLPIVAKQAGYELWSMTFKLDPYVLYDRFGHILHEWPCGYEPCWQDLYQVCLRLQS